MFQWGLKKKILLSWFRKQIPSLSWRFEAFEFVLHFWGLFFLVLSKASRMLGRNYLLKPKQSPNCLQMQEETTLKHRPHMNRLPCAPLTLQTCTTNHSGGSYFSNCACVYITACEPPHHRIIVSDLLLGAVGNHSSGEMLYANMSIWD